MTLSSFTLAEPLTKEKHVWLRGLKPEEAEALRKMYEDRYGK
jgi:hypothetical protein